MTNGSTDVTTIRVPRPLHARLERLKPFESMSYAEFVGELADIYETRHGDSVLLGTKEEATGPNE